MPSLRATPLAQAFRTYTITYVNGQMTVNPAALAIAARNINKVVGTAYTFAGTEFTAMGLVNGDNVTSVTLTSAGARGRRARPLCDHAKRRCRLGPRELCHRL